MILLIHSYPKGSDTLKRHWPLVQINSGATDFVIVTTTDGNCWVPEGISSVAISKDCYVDGSHLPTRLIDTLDYALKTEHEHILVAEYDTLFFHPIRYKEMEHATASHHAGGEVWGSKAKAFFHNPWLFRREFAQKFVETGREAVREGVCYRNRGQASSAECSPDVFYGYICERLNQPVQTDLWTEHSRNGFDVPKHLEEAREARINGIDVIHGIKSKAEYDYVMS